VVRDGRLEGNPVKGIRFLRGNNKKGRDLEFLLPSLDP